MVIQISALKIRYKNENKTRIQKKYTGIRIKILTIIALNNNNT